MYSKREDFTMKRVLLLIYILSGLFSIKRSAYAEIAWEYRIKEDDDLFRYRNMLTIKLPKFTPFKVQPYIAEEFFYDFCEYKLNKNRIYSGIDFKVFINFRAGTYYILESLKKKGDWTNINVLGTTLKYNF